MQYALTFYLYYDAEYRNVICPEWPACTQQSYCDRSWLVVVKPLRNVSSEKLWPNASNNINKYALAGAFLPQH